MNGHKLAISILIVALGLGVAACGGDDSPETPIVVATDATQDLSKAEFITELDAVCAQVDAQIAEFAAQGEGVSAATEIAELRQSVLDEIQDLGPPSQGRSTLDEFVSSYRDMVKAGRELGLAVERGGDTSEPEATLLSARDQAETAASAYGFKNCGQPIDESAAPDASGGGATDDGGGAVPAPVPVPPPSDDGGGTGGDTGGDPGGGGGGGTDGGGGVGVG